MSKFDKEVEQTLSSIDTIKRAPAPEGFLESLIGKMIFSEEQIVWFNRAKYATAAMIVCTILNAVLLFSNSSNEREDLIDSVSSEWNLNEPLY